MTSTTDKAPVSSTPTDQANDEESRAKRVALMKRAVDRMVQEADHVEQTERVIKPEIAALVKFHSLGEVAELFIAIDEAADRLDAANKTMQQLLSFTREVSLPERMDEEMTKSFSATSGDQVVRTTRLFASIATGKTDEAMDWMRKNDMAALIKETVNSSSLSAAAKELIENGQELPDDLFTTYMKNGVSIRKAKAKKG